MIRSLLVALFLAFLPTASLGQTVSSLVAGAPWAYRGTTGPALDAPLGQLEGVAVDSLGNVYAADIDNNLVVKITPAGVLSAVAGNGTAGYSGDGGPATNAQLNMPVGVAVDVAGNVYIADYRNNRVRKVAANGVITTFAGNGTQGLSGLGGPAAAAQVWLPWGVAADKQGNVYIGSYPNGILRVDASGLISSYAGGCFGVNNNSCISEDGPANLQLLYDPRGLAVGADGTLYFSELISNRVRKVSAGFVTTVAGQLDPLGPFSSLGGFSGDGGPATSAKLAGPAALAFDTAGNLYIADSNNLRVRKVDRAGIISTFAGNGGDSYAGDGGSATAASLSHPEGIGVDAAGNVYVGERANVRIRRVTAAGVISTFAGNGRFKFAGDGGPAVNANLNSPSGLKFDAAGNLYFADSLNNRVRKISRDGIITTIAGSDSKGFSGDGGRATNAALTNPADVAIDASGNVYIADAGNNRVRRVDANGIITTVAGNGTQGFSEDALATQSALWVPSGVAVLDGNLYIADTGNGRLRLVTPDGKIRTIAGGGTASPGDGGPATNAILFSPIRVLPRGDAIFVLEHFGNLRKITPDGTITTFWTNDQPPGSRKIPYFVDGIAVGTDGSIYVYEEEPNFLVRIKPDGSATHTNLSSTTGLSQVAMTSDLDGNIYISETNGYRIIKLVTECTAPAEPSLTLNLPPGFYIGEVRNAAGTDAGFWGMEVLVQKGVLAGGFNLGGATRTTASTTAFGAFNLPSTQTVAIRVDAQVVPGGDPTGFSMAVRLLDGARNQIGTDHLGTSFVQFDATLSPGFYIAEVRGPISGPTATFQMALSSNNFAGGVDVGGYVASGLVGFGAFFVPEQQDVTIHLFGPTYGNAGTSCPRLTLLDASRNVIRTAP